MEQRKDYLEREIERLIAFLEKLLNVTNIETSNLEQIDEALEKELGFCFFNIKNEALVILLEKQEVAVLMSLLNFINKLELRGFINKDKKQLLSKVIDEKRGVFSFERML